MDAPKRILCLGSVTTDIIVSPVDGLPSPGSLQAVSNTATYVGGCASNASLDLAKLGMSVSLCCRVGQDSFGDFVMEQTRKAGVDIRGVIRDPASGTTSSVVCVNSQGERSFLYYPGSTSAFQAEDIPSVLLRECDILFVAGAMLLSSFDGEPCARLLEKARAEGKFTVMDTAWDFDNIWLPKLKPSLSHLDLFMPSYEEAVHLTGKTEPSNIADFFFECGVGSVIIKLGGDGAYLCPSPEERYTLSTYRNIQPVDTTGAGDSFCAGFLCGLALGWDFRRCGEFANAVGTHCVMAVGASTGIKPLAEILEFMERTPIK